MMEYNGNGPTGITRTMQATKNEVMCPYCGSKETELFSLFGQQLLTVQYYCNACHTPFEHIKDDDVLDDYAARKED